jgi:leucyl/phenylalanyl-tRNA--protein transferase
LSRRQDKSQITPDLLLRAYAMGLFPMAEQRESKSVFWVSPEDRGVIPLGDFHVPRRLARTVRSDRFEVSVDRDFDSVIRACAEAAPGREQSWISADIVALYTALHRQGHAHSFECRQDGALVGGLYGVSVGAAFFGESMFSRARDASKIALVHLVARLIHCGFELLDAQFLTDHLSQFGAIAITREVYLRDLESAIAKPAEFYCSAPSGSSGIFSLAVASGDVGLTGPVDATVGDCWPGWLVLQLITQTS